MMPNHALQRTRPSRSGCNPASSWAGSLSLGRSAASRFAPMKKFAWILLFPVLLTCSGCGTLFTHVSSESSSTTQYGQGVYLGTIFDARLIAKPFSSDEPSWGYLPIGVIDIPFSFAADTIILPFDLAGYIARKEKSE